jgi:hypothetical protein
MGEIIQNIIHKVPNHSIIDLIAPIKNISGVNKSLCYFYDVTLTLRKIEGLK